MTRGLVDVVTHLDDVRIPPDALDAIFARAVDARLSAVMNAGTNPTAVDAEKRAALQASAKAGNVELWEAFGLHPCFVETEQDLAVVTAALRRLLDDGAVAVGEIGLDYRKTSPDADLQRRAFDEQLAVARDVDRPVIFHVVRAWDDFFATIDRHPGTRGVVHGFSGAPEVARAIFKRGLSISVGAAVLWPNSKRLAKTLASLTGNLRALMVETDTPDHPQDDAAFAEPAHLRPIILAVAERCGVTPEAVAMASSENAYELFAPH